MAILALWATALVILVVAGAIVGWVAFFRVRDLSRQLDALRRELAGARGDTLGEGPSTAPGPAVVPAPAPAMPPDVPPDQAPDAPSPLIPTAPPAARAGSGLLARLAASWMLWLGGLCVGLAGIFMVKYSIDAGLLGPGARVALAMATGLGLHGAAEWLRRRSGADPSFAALAGGASITLYGAVLAGLHLYALFEPRLAFALLAIVSLATMGLALAQGPFLAAIGILGAYVVPILVSDNSGNIVAAMVFSLLVSAAGLLLLRHVYRPWLWWGLVAGALGWLAISLTSRVEVFRGIYLALLAWGLVALPAGDWLLARGEGDGEPGARRHTLFGRPWRADQLALALVVLAWGWAIQSQGFSAGALVQWLPMVVVLGLAARCRESLAWLPWLGLGVQWLAWLSSALHGDPAGSGYQLRALTDWQARGFMEFAAAMSMTQLALALLHLRTRGFDHRQMALACLAPLLWLALAYLLVSGLALSLWWSVAALLAGLGYGLVAGLRVQRSASDGAALWFFLGGHFAYSLAAAIQFREAGLTLALAAQLVSLAWLRQRYPLPWLDRVIKGVLALVVARLTLNPWLATYPADVHWSLWTYGGATLCCLLAAWLSRRDAGLRRWLEAAGLHLLVLTLGAEVRYWLYDGAIFQRHYGLTEAAINASLWTAMALTYHHRARHSTGLEGFYRGCSRILLVLGAGSYALAATTLNPLWSGEAVAPTPVINVLLLAYGLPVVMALAVALYHEGRWRPAALATAGAGLLLFATLEIRHLWQGAVALHLPTGNGELYSYSAVWLLLAVAALIAGGLWRWRGLYRAGMALLAVVIAKIFLVDMAGLAGLLRVASFMGLGLALLGLAWLHRRFGGAAPGA